MNEKRFQKTRIVDKWGGIYDSETDEILNVNDVEHKLNEQQATINNQEQKIKILQQEINDTQAILEMLEKGILDCLFNNKSVGMLAEEMRLVE